MKLKKAKSPAAMLAVMTLTAGFSVSAANLNGTVVDSDKKTIGTVTVTGQEVADSLNGTSIMSKNVLAIEGNFTKVNAENADITNATITGTANVGTLVADTSVVNGNLDVNAGDKHLFVNEENGIQLNAGNSSLYVNENGTRIENGLTVDHIGSTTPGTAIVFDDPVMGTEANFENINADDINANNATITGDATVNGKLTTNDFSAQTGYIKEGAIENLNSTNISTVNMSSENATIGDLTVTSSATVNGDFAVENGSATMNVGNGYIQSAVGGNSVTINSDGVSLNSGAVVVDSEGMHVNTTLDASNLKADEAYIKEGAIEHLNSDTITANEISSGSVSTGELNVSGNANVDGNLNVNGKFTINNQELATSVDISDVKGKIGVDATGNYKAIEVKDQSGKQVSTLTDAVNTNYAQIQNNSNAISSLGNRVSDLGDEIDNVGAISAALAGLHPLDYDGTGSKFQISAAVGTYDGSQAAALGAFYHFNRDVMLSLGGATAFDGDQKTAANLGVTFRIGEGASGKAVSDDVMARLEAMDQKIAALEQENKDLKNVLGAIDTSLSKEFPDVPANHWAYEAVTKLAGNDVVAGYPDGEFHGDRTMTRYEMAEVIYKAMQKGAKVDQKLVNEFKPEMEQVAANQNA